MSNQKYSKLGTTDDSSVSIDLASIPKSNQNGDSHQHVHGENCNHDHGNHSHSHGNSHNHSHKHESSGSCCNKHDHSSSGGGHNHDHEDQLGDFHDPRDNCQKKKKNTAYAMRFFTMFMPFNCIMLQQFWLNETLQGNRFEFIASTLLMWSILFMCNVTYYQSVTIKNEVVKRMPPAADPSIFDPVMRNNAICKDCNYWKPMRTKHCRACGTCNLRMDHHCPWITNCVGLRNNRAFVLFTIYMGIGATQYCYRTIMYFQHLSGSENFWQNSSFFYLYWLLTTIILVPICIMLIGLSIFHSFLLVNNATTLETMGGLQLGLPFRAQQKIDPSKRSINIFNRGLISNVRQFFSEDQLFWWWPFQTFTNNDGSSFQMSPPITFNDIMNYVKRTTYNEDGINLNLAIGDFNQKIEDEKMKLKDCNMQVGDKIFELWKEVEAEQMRQEQAAIIQQEQAQIANQTTQSNDNIQMQNTNTPSETAVTTSMNNDTATTEQESIYIF